jgi:hypothetical protein
LHGLIAVSIILIIPILISSPSSPLPADEWVDIEVALSTNKVDMAYSSYQSTNMTIPGTVSVLAKPPGERVTVQMSVEGNFGPVYGACYPNTLSFTEEGLKPFNFTITMTDNASPGDIYRIILSASASARVGSDISMTEVEITPIPELSADAFLVRAPGPVEAGRTTTGEVNVRNNGSQYGVYFLVVASDPGQIVSDVEFRIRLELVTYVERTVPFYITTAKTAQPGTHDVMLALTTQLEDGTILRMDTFEFKVEIEEPDDASLPWALMLVLALLIIVLAAFLVRRKG